MKWIEETFDVAKILSKYPSNGEESISSEQERFRKMTNDVFEYKRSFGDPRLEYYADLPIKIKDHWFPDFQRWAVANGLSYPEPQPMFSSMTVFASSLITLENKKFLIDERNLEKEKP